MTWWIIITSINHWKTSLDLNEIYCELNLNQHDTTCFGLFVHLSKSLQLKEAGILTQQTDLNHIFISGLALHSVWHVCNRPVCAHRHHLHWHRHRLPVQHRSVQDLCFLWHTQDMSYWLHSSVFDWFSPSFLHLCFDSFCLYFPH